MSPQRRKDAKNIGIYIILQRNENFFSNKPNFIVFKPLRLCVFAVYELFRIRLSGDPAFLNAFLLSVCCKSFSFVKCLIQQPLVKRRITDGITSPKLVPVGLVNPAEMAWIYQSRPNKK